MSEQLLSSKPLSGKRILVTRTREQAGKLSEQLVAAGARPLELPVIRIAPPADWQPVDQALHRLFLERAYDWLILTSANGVRMVMERACALGYEPSSLSHLSIATIGPATAAALTTYHLSATLIPEAYIAESVAEALRMYTASQGMSLHGQRVLLARAAEARQVLISELEQDGARVDVVAAYQTLPVQQNDERGREVITLLRTQQLDVITFTSSSTVQHFMHWLSQSAPDIALHLAYPGTGASRPLLACIGPITAATVRSYGLEVAVEASAFTTAGLVEALIEYHKERAA